MSAITPYNLAYTYIAASGNTAGKLYFYKCGTTGTSLFNKLNDWDLGLKHTAAFVLEIPQNSQRFDGSHINNEIAILIRDAKSVKESDTFFITYLNIILLTSIMSNCIIDSKFIRLFGESSLSSKIVPVNDLIISPPIKAFILAIGLDKANGNIHLYKVDSRILKDRNKIGKNIPYLEFYNKIDTEKSFPDGFIHEIKPTPISDGESLFILSEAQSDTINNSTDYIVNVANNLRNMCNTMGNRVVIQKYDKAIKEAIMLTFLKSNNENLTSLNDNLNIRLADEVSY